MENEQKLQAVEAKLDGKEILTINKLRKAQPWESQIEAAKISTEERAKFRELAHSYDQRDSEVEMLDNAFYQHIGLGFDDIFTEIGENEFDYETNELKGEILGWGISFGEETTRVYKDNVFVGKVTYCARGNMYSGDAEFPDGTSWYANQNTHGEWKR